MVNTIQLDFFFCNVALKLVLKFLGGGNVVKESYLEVREGRFRKVKAFFTGLCVFLESRC